MKKVRKRPFATQLNSDMPLAEKMARIRRRVAAKGYFNHRHPKVQIHTTNRLHFQHRGKLHRKDKLNLNSYARRTFTSQEIEQMWLALCRLVEFFGGNKALLSRECQISQNTLAHWIRVGRISPLGADIIHNLLEIPFTRKDLRPDITPKAWQRFDRDKARLYAQREEMQEEAFNSEELGDEVDT